MFGRPTRWPFLLKAFPLWQPLTDVWRRTTNWPVLGKYFRWLHNREHYDVTFVPINQELKRDESTVIPTQVVADIIRESCHRVIMKACLCRVSCGCEHYPINYGCIFLGASAREIDPSMGKAVSVDEALVYLDKCTAAGLIPQIGRVDADPFMLGISPKKWDRFLTLCFCCPCCCVAMRNWRQWSPEVRERMHRLEGLRLEVTEDCTGCGLCTKSCFTAAITIDGGRARISNECRGCGICVGACPQQAIKIKVDDGNKLLQEARRRIKQYADVATG